MDSRSILGTLERLIESSKIAVLATSDPDGQPHMRWMTPTVLKGRSGAIYAVTSPTFEKTTQLAVNPRVEWMVQSRSMDEILCARGTMNVLDNPAVKALVLEALGAHLATFWKMNSDEGSLVVLETALDYVRYVKPASGEHHEVNLGDEYGEA